MLKISELRIGNRVKCKISNDAGIYQVLGIPAWNMDGSGDGKEPQVMIDRCPKQLVAESQLKPVSITPEILIEYGFAKIMFDAKNESEGCYYELNINRELYYDIGFVSGDKNGVFEVCLFPYEQWFRFKHLHQLQNLYYALTGIELLNSTQNDEPSVATGDAQSDDAGNPTKNFNSKEVGE